MILPDPAAFAAVLSPRRGLLGLDLGTVTIGVATSDRLLTASKDNQLRVWDFRQLGTLQVRTINQSITRFSSKR